MSQTPRDEGDSDPTAPTPYPSEYSAPVPPEPQPQAGPYGTPPPAYPPPHEPPAAAYPPQPYGDPNAPYGTPPPYYASAAPQTNTSALVLTIVGAIGTVTCCLPLPALILGIIALTKQSTDPENSAKLAKYGWITFGAMVALAMVAFVAVIAFGVLTAPTSP